MKKIVFFAGLILFCFSVLCADNPMQTGNVVKKKRTIIFKEMKVKGAIQKPEAIYILSRARFNYQTFDLNVSFLNNIRDVIKDDNVF